MADGFALRERYLNRFCRQGCERIAAVPVTEGGRGTLFTNSVLQQFVHELLGDAPPRADAVAAHQICLRLAGQSSFYGSQDQRDAIEEGKRTLLFEQLGLVRFRGATPESIRRTLGSLLEFIFLECGIAARRTHVTVHVDDDDLAAIVQDVGSAAGPMIRVAKAHRSAFAAPQLMGRAVHFVVDRVGQVLGAHSKCEPTCGCGRWLDIGDLILFHDSHGALRAIDSAFSLERLLLATTEGAAFETEVAETPLIAAHLVEHLGADRIGSRLRVLAIAEQIRAASLLLGEGITPGARGASFITRRLLRASLTRFALDQLNLETFGDTVNLALELMRQRNPYCTTASAVVAERVRAEQTAFGACVSRAEPILRRVYDFHSNSPRVSPEEWQRLSGTHALTPGVVALIGQGIRGVDLGPNS